MAYLEVLAHN